MEKKLQELYSKLVKISADYLIYQERNNIDKIKENIPEIQEFVVWFLESNKFAIEEGMYKEMCQSLVCILNDILSAFQQGDRVLAQDAMAYGLLEYLELFVGREQVENDTV